MITTCTNCGKGYYESSEEMANEPGRLCMACWNQAKAANARLESEMILPVWKTYKCERCGNRDDLVAFTNESQLAVAGRDRTIRIHLCPTCLTNIAFEINSRDKQWEKENGRRLPWREPNHDIGKGLIFLKIPEPDAKTREIHRKIQEIIYKAINNGYRP